MAKKKLVRPVIQPVNGWYVRHDIHPAVLAYAKALGWTWDNHEQEVPLATRKFTRHNDGVWVCRLGWMFARLCDIPGQGLRWTDHRAHDTLMGALEDKGPGVGKFEVRKMNGTKLFPKPMDRSHHFILSLTAVGESPTWREDPVGTEHLCRRSIDGDVEHYSVTRVE